MDAARELRRKPPEELTADDRAAIDAADKMLDAFAGRRKKRREFSVSSGNSPKINAMVTQALPHKSVGPNDLDSDPLLFNCENVTLKLSRIVDPDDPGDERPRYRLFVDPLKHDRTHYITKIAPVIYNPEATCPRWDAFLERFQPNENIRRFLQVYHGLAMTGLIGPQCFIYNYGTGANGKSTFTEALAKLMGGYSDLLNSDSIAGRGEKRGDQATPDLAALPGVRFLRISELPRGEEIKEALIKALTGGEEIKVRHLLKAFFKFMPCFKASMSGNDKPRLTGTDYGIWRRLRLILWAVAEFEEERSGILNWLLAGLDIYMQEGLQTPQEVTDATLDYREEMDPVGEFMKYCLEPCDGHFETARDVYLAYVKWSLANGVKAWTENTFGRVLPTKGIVKEKCRVRRYLNVKLKDIPDVSVPPPPAVEAERG